MAALVAASGLALPLAGAAGCATSTRHQPDGDIEPGPSWDVVVPIYPDGEPALDLLVVVDNSNGTHEWQTTLASQVVVLFHELLHPTPDPATGLVPPAVTDLHVGVASIDMGSGGYEVMTCSDAVDGDDGALQASGRYEGCQPTYRAADCDDAACPWLVHSPEHPDDPPIWDDFGCIATLGTRGCGFEQPLESALAALTRQAGPGGTNHGFLRDDSVLAVLIETDEDDCSAADTSMYDPDRLDLGPLNTRCAMHPELLLPVSRYEEGLRGLRPGRPDRVVLGVVAGVPIDGSWEPGDPLEELEALVQPNPPNPNELVRTCETGMGYALAPLRLVDLAYRFGENGLVASGCRADWTDTLTDFARLIQRHLPGTCLPYPLPIGVAGGACRVVETLADGSPCPHEQLWQTDLGLDETGRRRCHLAEDGGLGWGWRLLPYDPSDPVAARCEHGQIDLGETEIGEGSDVAVECWLEPGE